jgi:hypothetical protein
VRRQNNEQLDLLRDERRHEHDVHGSAQALDKTRLLSRGSSDRSNLSIAGFPHRAAARMWWIPLIPIARRLAVRRHTY